MSRCVHIFDCYGKPGKSAAPALAIICSTPTPKQIPMAMHSIISPSFHFTCVLNMDTTRTVWFLRWTSVTVFFLFWRGIWRIEPMCRVVSVHVIYWNRNTKQNNKESETKTKQSCKVQQQKTENNYPQPIVGKQAAIVWFSIRDNDWQLPLIGNHTRPKPEIQNIEPKHRMPNPTHALTKLK